MYGVKVFSICLSVETLTLIISGLAEQNEVNFLDLLAKKV
jgi:hypothetical protein